jgi:cytochrome b561
LALTEYRVWDRSQRVFHWVNFLAVVTLAVIGTVILNADRLGIPNDPGLISLKTVHVYVGYLFILNLLSFWLLCLLVGSMPARL